jgi:uncharacterized oxidoreductase
MLAVNPEAFVGLDEFKRSTAELLGKVKNLPAVAGERVMVPGEPEKESKERRLKEGIPVPESTWGEIKALCSRLGVEVK